ncbi:MAG: ribonuclease HI, partial [Thiotrichaceae bacterium]|nr:ribonuclease HI [Thiotrichaceae bacterium]
MDNTIYIYTDGACKGNPGPGGWGALMKYNDTEKEF